MRTPLIAGNAKMNLDRSSLAQVLQAVADDLSRTPAACDVAYCPPFPLLPEAARLLDGSTIYLGAQNMHAKSSGAFTGEVSAAMLLEAGCRMVILGHSERRTLFGETDSQVREKTKAALAAGLVPIVCVGETEDERERGKTNEVLSRQAEALRALPVENGHSIVVAYEPVWAIGTGKTATPDQAQEAHDHLRQELSRAWGVDVAGGVRILYGGSVKPGNAESILGQDDIDGALVGGASLNAESFIGIVRALSAK